MYASPYIFIRTMLNMGITSYISLTKAIRQGCSHSLLLFVIITPMLVMLSRCAMNGDIVGLHLPSRGQLEGEDLAYDSVMFLRASRENLEKGMLLWNQLALAFRIHINWRKSSLISCTERDL